MSLRTALQNKDIKEIRSIANGLPMADLADLLESLTVQERVLFFRLLKTEEQSEIFAQLEPHYQEQLVASFTDKQIDEIVGDLYADEIADLIEEVPHELQKTILLSISDKETREKVNKVLKFEDDQTGSVMTVDLVLLNKDLTVAQALAKIKKYKDDYKMAHYFFVVDEHTHLLGYISLEDLAFASKKSRVKTLAKPSGSVLTTTHKEEAVNEFAKYDMSVLPVVSTSGEVVGMITADDVLDIAIESATRDAHLSAGIVYSNTYSYAKASIFKLFKSRVVWLMLLMISSTVSQIVIDSFINVASHTIDHGSLTSATVSATISSAIAAIIPVISGAGGNAGSQSSAMVIRSLATGDLTVKDYLKVLKKELGTSGLIGLALGIANFIRLIIFYSVTGDIHDSHYIFLSLAASIALFIVINLANIVGGLLPILAKILKMDPAVMAAPLLTTLIDAVSSMTLFGVSIAILLIVI